MGSRKISDLHPLLQPKAELLLEQCHAQGIELIITCTYRSGEEQDQLYKIGRTIPGAKVTNCKAGQSNHNFTLNGKPASKAFDVVPLRHGKAVWGTTGEDGKLWNQVGSIGEKLGLAWAGRWKTFKEYPHFELAVTA